MDDHYGSWMHDASSSNDIMPDRLWVTRHNETSYIYEYKSKEYFKNNTVSSQIKLPHPFQVGSLRTTDNEIPLIIITPFPKNFKM